MSSTDGPIATPSHIGGLTSRTFISLLVAQFFAAFNDQAIHAAAMFFAINTLTMTEPNAISLMPILFYAPWAIFCTISGWLADRYSKRNAIVIWKVAEVIITGVAWLGFYLGREGGESLGPWLVLSTVFMMGTHSAFFVPAKYGVMPEILPPHLLSKGNGILESLSFLSVILGTVSGGVLSFIFLGQEWIIGAILFTLAVIGAVASLLIRKMPPTNPSRPFPSYVYGPLVQSLRTLISTGPLRLAVAGIAFFTFVVAFMRAAVYMLGESQNPRWDELKTSVVVGTVALGIGFGSPLAGWLSGRKVQLRIVLLGALGMVVLLVLAGLCIEQLPILIASTIGIGFCTGFYIVPLFTLLQHRAPKTSKGEMIAASNFINVTGAIAASLLFRIVVLVSQSSGLVPEVSGREVIAEGELITLDYSRGRPAYFEVREASGHVFASGPKPGPAPSLNFGQVLDNVLGRVTSDMVIEVNQGVRAPSSRRPGAAPGEAGSPTSISLVMVTRFTVSGVVHYDLDTQGHLRRTNYDRRKLPRYLFLGAAVLTAFILLALLRPCREVQRELDGVSA